MKQNLKDKTVIVIGGSSGIGLSVAQMAYEAGADVTLTSRSSGKAMTVAERIGPRIHGAALNIDDDEAINIFFAAFGTIDHIYIAAGSTNSGTLTEKKLEEHMELFNTRLLGSLRVIRAAANKITSGGSITFTGGVSTDRPIAGAWVTGLGTASAEQLARVMVMEFPHIRFNAVSPGYTDTPMWDEIMGSDKKEILNTIAEKLPVKKIATADEVASAVVFLMDNPSITGEVIHVDGGLRLV